MTDRPAVSSDRAVAFGPFRLLPAQQLLLENESPVRLGSRAFEILAALLEHSGEVVGKNELIARVWPNTHIDENTLRVHVAGLRKALGDGQPGRRYLASVPGRGYRFVAPVDLAAPGVSATQPDAKVDRVHNIPISQVRAVGRANTIRALRDQLPKQRFITIVGAGGVGKTTVALALAETLLSTYEDGVRFADLGPVDDPQFIGSTLGATLGLSIHPANDISQLVEFLRDKRMLIVLDSCENVIEAAALLAEQLLLAPRVHILATSREPLRAGGEWVHHLRPLDVPADPSGLSAAEALTYPAVQLFVERAAAILDGFELSDADAPVVSDICGKLGGIALAIELAAARVDAFGIQQLAVLLDDQFRILKLRKRTAQPRHQSLAAALDWSYEFLPEFERAILCRLSVFAGAFTLDAALAVIGESEVDAIDGVARLVSKSLLSADVGGPAVLYRLLETTRAYARRKLIESGGFNACARRHALYHRELLERAESEFRRRTTADWLEDYGRRIDDVRSALSWAFSPSGDATIGVALTVASGPLWLQLSLADEGRESVERALASQAAETSQGGPAQMKLQIALASALLQVSGPVPRTDILYANALAIAESLDDDLGQISALLGLSIYHLFAGEYQAAFEVAEKCNGIAARTGDMAFHQVGDGVAAPALHHLAEYPDARFRSESMLNHYSGPPRHPHSAFRVGARAALSSLLWIQGFPDQALRCAESALDDAHEFKSEQSRANMLAQAVCPIALYVGDLAAAEELVATLLDLSTKHALPILNAQGRCLKGVILLLRGDAAGPPLLKAALDRLEKMRFTFHYVPFAAALAQGMNDVGRTAEAKETIERALARADHDKEHWCLPELLRIKGEILRSGGLANGIEAAEDYFRQALGCANRQEALSWELRAATSLARLWHRNGKTAEAEAQLSSVYNRFTEGFDTIDLRTARALIDELRIPANLSDA